MASSPASRSYPRPVKLVLDIACGRHSLSKFVPPLLWLLDGVLTSLIVWKVPYTEIDWVAYMEQVSQFVKGERDYTKMEGGTGPLVYPAAHLYTYTALYHLTDEGKNILLAQQFFAVLYMATLAVVMLCYWQARAPPYIFPLLILSKRLHSVFVLRCFNDCFTVFFFFLAIFLFQRRSWTFGAMAFTWGLGIKMSLLLSLPAVIIVLFLGRGFWGCLRLVWLMVQVQMAIAVPFFINAKGYFGRAFELSRQFKFEWTVNWRMLGEEVFLSRWLALGLLTAHASVLVLFIVQRWVRLADRPLSALIPPMLRLQAPLNAKEEAHISNRVRPDFILATILSGNIIGLLFARSLHYQFYSYLAWTTPYLLWRFSESPVLVYTVWAAQEWAWNVFPSTDISSAVVVGALAVTVGVAYFGDVEEELPSEKEKRKAAAKEKKQKKNR